MTQDYRGQKIALLTQHGKEQVIAPVLEPALGCSVQLVSHFDTDQLGTFTRDIPRPGSQLEAARRKARKGMELSGLPIGLASEGSFTPDPLTGLFPWNVELLVLIDELRGIEIVGMAQGEAQSGHLLAGDWEAVEDFARAEDFPAHQLVLRPQDQDAPRLHKGIADWDRLRSCFEDCKAQADNGLVFIETDLRAFANPTRMSRIGDAAADLLRRLQSRCPECDQPGYWVTERQAGLPCSACGEPTSIYRAEVWQCPACAHRAVVPRSDRTSVGPQHCQHCNP
ncbi:MAG: hypothetical protein RLZZ555_508 [Pseudomonadota bacterium]|jgi:DNA-directed RNA polymerase subunit RPC12/RpoP